MRYWILVFSFFISHLSSHSVVFVHIGPDLPEYLPLAIEQARLFNRECSFYLVANREAIRKSPLFLDKTVQCVPCETLTCSKHHQKFLTQSCLDHRSLQGFWTYTSERFFYLEELIREYDLKDVFHLENDVMLYTDLSCLLPLFHEHYEGKIGATFDNESRCIPGFVYIAQAAPISQLVQFMASKAKSGRNDMEILQDFKERYDRLYIDHLPILPPAYSRDHVLSNALGATAKYPERFSEHFTVFQSIFDAAAIGQYLGGISPRNGAATPGFINESCIFDPSLFAYEWRRDEENRRVPWIDYQGFTCPINNLHIHSKNLSLFSSGDTCLDQKL